MRESPQETRSSNKQRVSGDQNEEITQPSASLQKRCSSTPALTSFCWEELIKEYPKPKPIEHHGHCQHFKAARRPKLTRRSATAGPLVVEEEPPSLKDGDLHRMMRGSYSAMNLTQLPTSKHYQGNRELDYARDRNRPVFRGAMHSMMYGRFLDGVYEPGEDHRHLPRQPPTTPEEHIQPTTPGDTLQVSGRTDPEMCNKDQHVTAAPTNDASHFQQDKREGLPHTIAESGNVGNAFNVDQDVACKETLAYPPELTLHQKGMRLLEYAAWTLSVEKGG